MDSPDGRCIKVTSRPSASSTVQDSIFFRDLSSLSPIKPVKAVRYTQRFLETSFPTSPVFTSSHTSLQREPTFLQRDEGGAAGSNVYGHFNAKLNPVLTPCMQKQLQSCSPSVCVDEYLADGDEGCMSSAYRFPQKDTGVPTLSNCTEGELPLVSAVLVETEGHQRDDQKFDDYLNFESEKEVSQHLHGIRTHLQFDAAIAGKSPVPFHVNFSGISNGMEGISSAHSITSQFHIHPSRCLFEGDRKICISAPLSSGVGLCLNSLKSQVTPMPAMEYNLLELNGSSSSTPAVASVHMDDSRLERQHSCNSPCDKQPVPQEERMPTSQNADLIEEFNQGKPKRQRKRAACSSKTEDCRHCNCKRSKCLKLYCDCFATRLYCAESCACVSCLNKPEYEDTIHDTREQIESRNPLAFAPKVVHTVTISPANEVRDGSSMTPASARHKVGCNCKKSKCVKKYCECYQGKAGCSNQCQCRGCKNSFGTKPGPISKRDERQRTPSHDYLENQELVADCTTTAGTDTQYSATLEELAGIRHPGPWSESQNGAAASSASTTVEDPPMVSLDQLHQGDSLQSSASQLHWQAASKNLTPLQEGKASHYLGSDMPPYQIMNNGTREIPTDSSTPTNAVEASSSNQKLVSPQLGSEEQRSSNSSDSRRGAKFILQDVSSFPLTLYSNSKDGGNQNGNHHRGSSSNL